MLSQVLEHEKFNPKTLFNDVAVLKLSELVEVAPHVGTICLPDDLSQVNLRDCVATGWGKESFCECSVVTWASGRPISYEETRERFFREFSLNCTPQMYQKFMQSQTPEQTGHEEKYSLVTRAGT